MKIFFKIEFTTIMMMYFTGFTISEEFEIFRARPNGSDGWTEGTDTFKLSSSFCDENRNGSMNCARFGANIKSENGKNCLCSCPNENATLMYNNGEWRCLKNSLVRDLLGNDGQTYIYFVNENKDNELRMLNISENRRLSLSRGVYSHCRVHEESSLVTACNGSEVSFSSTLFTLQKQGRHNFPYSLKVGSGVSDANLLKGRILKLGIRCGRKRHYIYRKLLFKFEGKITCSISIPTAQPTVTTRIQNTALTLSPSTPSRTSGATKRSPITSRSIVPTGSDIPTTVSDAVSDTSPTSSEVRPTVSDTPQTISEFHPTVSDTPSTNDEARPTVPDTQPTISVGRPTTSDTPLTTPDTTTASSSNAPERPNNPESEERTDNNSSSLALIAGLVASVLAIVVIVGFLVYRRRNSKQKPNSSNRSCEGKEKPDDENAYKELDFREQPMYASNYQVPHRSSETHYTESNPDTDHVYAPLNISEGQNVYGHVGTQEPMYRALENPTYDSDITCLNYGRSISVEQPMYNLVEELSVRGAEGAARDGTRDDQPVYNVLEEPYTEGSEGPDHYGAMSLDEPAYNMLERPYVEKPDDNPEFVNEPIYNVLEEDPYPEVPTKSDDYGSRNVQRPCV